MTAAGSRRGLTLGLAPRLRFQAAEEILKEVRRITEEPVTEDELRVAKEGRLNSFAFNFDSTGKIATPLAELL